MNSEWCILLFFVYGVITFLPNVFFKPGKSSCCRLQRCYKQASQWTAMLESVSEVSEMLKSSTERHSCPVMWPTITGGSQAWKRVAQSNVHRFDWKRTKEKEGSDATACDPRSLSVWPRGCSRGSLDLSPLQTTSCMSSPRHLLLLPAFLSALYTLLSNKDCKPCKPSYSPTALLTCVALWQKQIKPSKMMKKDWTVLDLWSLSKTMHSDFVNTINATGNETLVILTHIQ